MNPIDILNKFIIQELDGDVFLLLDYDLKRLKNNAVLGRVFKIALKGSVN